MSLFKDEINKRIIAGNFPIERLYPAECQKIKSIDFEQFAKPGLDILKTNPLLFYGLFNAFRKRIKEMEQLDHPELFEQKVNVLINTTFHPDSLSMLSSPYMIALQLYPAITYVDKVLWYGALAYSERAQLEYKSDNYDINLDMMYTWIYLLLFVQKKERTLGITLNTSRLDESNIYEIIMNSWGKYSNKYHMLISNSVKNKFEELFTKRDSIRSELLKDRENQNTFAQKSNEEWKIFLEIINDISSKQALTVAEINNATSKRVCCIIKIPKVAK